MRFTVGVSICSLDSDFGFGFLIRHSGFGFRRLLTEAQDRDKFSTEHEMVFEPWPI